METSQSKIKTLFPNLYIKNPNFGIRPLPEIAKNHCTGDHYISYQQRPLRIDKYCKFNINKKYEHLDITPMTNHTLQKSDIYSYILI